MKTQIEGLSIRDVIKLTGLPGWLLLVQPIIFIVFSRRRELNEYAAVDTSAVVFILYALVCMVVGFRSIMQNATNALGRDVLYKSPLVWFLTYTGLGLLSSIWSVSLALTGFRSIECFANILLICAVIQDLFETGNRRFIILWSLFYAAWDCIWSLIRTLQWTTDLGELLEAAQFTATTFFFMALYFTPRKWYNWLVIIMAVFSMSTVGYLGMTFGSISAFWLNARTKAFAVLSAFLLLLGIIYVGPYTLLKETVFFDKEDISLEETSGRDYLMEAAIESIDKYPMGLGFFAAEPFVLYAKHLSGISAHNSIFSAGMGLGYPGIALIVIFFISMGSCVFSKYIDNSVKPILIGCCCVAFIHCMGNPSLGSRVYAAWLPNAYVFILTCYFYIYDKYYDDDEEYDGEVNILK